MYYKITNSNMNTQSSHVKVSTLLWLTVGLLDALILLPIIYPPLMKWLLSL